MAKMLRDEDSTTRHLAAARRHHRRCRAVKGAAEFGERIDSARRALAQAMQETVQLLEAEEDARDDLELCGVEGADELRALDGRAKEYDRAHPGEKTHEQIFGGAGFSDLLHSDGTIDETTANTVASRVAALGETHDLAPFVAVLRARAAALQARRKAVEEALKARKLGEAAEELAQAALRRTYETNYLDARKKLGRPLAERLFPRLYRRSASPESGGEEGVAESPSAPAEGPPDTTTGTGPNPLPGDR